MPARRARSAAPLVVTAVLVAAVVVVGLLRWRGESAPAPAASATPAAAPASDAPAPLPYQRITSLPGSEMWPSLSPDGSQVVYSAIAPGGKQATLMVQTTAPVPGRAITEPADNVQDTMPAWSPNGREIAFMRIGPDPDKCSILLIPASGGDARRISACRPGWMGGLGWHPDGKHLITSQTNVGNDGAIYTIDLASGAWTRLNYQKGDNDVDMAPVYSPDGRWIAFNRNISLSDIWRVPAAGGQPERLTTLRTNIYSLAWTPDGKSLVFSRYLDGGLSLSRLDVDTRQVTDLGLRDSAFPAIAANEGSLAFVLEQSHSSIYSVDLAHPAAATDELTPVFPSTGKDLLPSIAPDGEQVTFMSDRSATMSVWWARLGRPDSLRLIEGVIPVPRYIAVWSRDSTRFLVIGRASAGPVNGGMSVFEFAPESGSVQRLPVPDSDPVYAEYIPDTTRILVVADRGAGRLGLTLYDRATSPWRALARLENVAVTRVDLARRRILFTRPAEPGLWQADLALQGAKRIGDRPAIGGGRRLMITAPTVWLAASDESCALRWLAVPEAEKTDGTCLRPGPLDVSGVSLDQPHQRLYFSAERDQNADIAFMRLRPAAAATR